MQAKSNQRSLAFREGTVAFTCGFDELCHGQRPPFDTRSVLTEHLTKRAICRMAPCEFSRAKSLLAATLKHVAEASRAKEFAHFVQSDKRKPRSTWKNPPPHVALTIVLYLHGFLRLTHRKSGGRIDSQLSSFSPQAIHALKYPVLLRASDLA
jgi:hypothetical protein